MAVSLPVIVMAQVSTLPTGGGNTVGTTVNTTLPTGSTGSTVVANTSPTPTALPTGSTAGTVGVNATLPTGAGGKNTVGSNKTTSLPTGGTAGTVGANTTPTPTPTALPTGSTAGTVGGNTTLPTGGGGNSTVGANTSPTPTPTALPTGGTGGTVGGNTTLPTGGGGNAAVGANTSPTPSPAPTTPPVTPPGGGGGGSLWSGGGGYVGSTGGIVNASTTATLVGASFSSCPLLQNDIIMGIGRNNDPIQVTKLQAFLKNTQELDVNVTGIFDQKTEAAVRAFQTKYLVAIMGPWDATQSSGIAYITTVKKINQLACAQPMTLTASEMATINAYKAAAANGTVGTPNVIGTTDNTDSTIATVAVPSTTDQTGGTAAVGNISIFQRFWNFIVGLFQ